MALPIRPIYSNATSSRTLGPRIRNLLDPEEDDAPHLVERTASGKDAEEKKDQWRPEGVYSNLRYDLEDVYDLFMHEDMIASITKSHDAARRASSVPKSACFVENLGERQRSQSMEEPRRNALRSHIRGKKEEANGTTKQPVCFNIDDDSYFTESSPSEQQPGFTSAEVKEVGKVPKMEKKSAVGEGASRLKRERLGKRVTRAHRAKIASSCGSRKRRGSSATVSNVTLSTTSVLEQLLLGSAGALNDSSAVKDALVLALAEKVIAQNRMPQPRSSSPTAPKGTENTNANVNNLQQPHNASIVHSNTKMMMMSYGSPPSPSSSLHHQEGSATAPIHAPDRLLTAPSQHGCHRLTPCSKGGASSHHSFCAMSDPFTSPREDAWSVMSGVSGDTPTTRADWDTSSATPGTGGGRREQQPYTEGAPRGQKIDTSQTGMDESMRKYLELRKTMNEKELEDELTLLQQRSARSDRREEHEPSTGSGKANTASTGSSSINIPRLPLSHLPPSRNDQTSAQHGFVDEGKSKLQDILGRIPTPARRTPSDQFPTSLYWMQRRRSTEEPLVLQETPREPRESRVLERLPCGQEMAKTTIFSGQDGPDGPIISGRGMVLKPGDALYHPPLPQRYDSDPFFATPRLGLARSQSWYGGRESRLGLRRRARQLAHRFTSLFAPVKEEPQEHVVHHREISEEAGMRALLCTRSSMVCDESTMSLPQINE